MRFRTPFSALLLLGSIGLTSCGQEPQLYVDKAWVRLPAVTGNPAAAYFTVHGGPKADQLVRVTSEVTLKTEMHDVVTENGVTSMTPIETVAIPALGKVEFKPGGKHAMLYDLRKNFKAGDKIQLTFIFAGGDQILVDAPLVAPGGDPATVTEDHKGH